MSTENINWAVYSSLPPQEAKYQLAHIHDDKTTSFIVAYALCLPLAFLAVITRFASRRIGRVLYGADDWMIVVAFV